MIDKGPKLRLRKPCRLHHKCMTDALFAGGRSLYAYPLRIVFRKVSPRELEAAFPAGIFPGIGKAQVLVSVPKRKLRRAVDRVLMRRRIREAYRKRLPALESMLDTIPEIATLSIGIIYIGPKPEPYNLVEQRLRGLLSQLENKLNGPATVQPSDSTSTT